jgi:alpha-amylase
LQNGTVDNTSAYESFMNVTASSYGYSLRNALYSNNLSLINTDLSGIHPTKAVNFVETHDTYEDGTSIGLSNTQRKLGWAIVAARANSTPLFFDRPTSSIGNEGDSLWKDPDITAVNHFRNSMAGQNEYLRWTNNNSTMLIDRGTIGTVIVNAGSSTYVNSPTNLSNGTYSNEGSANCTLTVSNGIISGNIPENSVIVLTTPSVTTNAISWVPLTPSAGRTVTIIYNTTGRSLQNSSTINVYWGYDGFKKVTSTPMTSTGNRTWIATLTVPSKATTKLDLCFANGSIWDNNNLANWSVPITISPVLNPGQIPNFIPHSGYIVDYDTSTLVRGNSFTLYYNGSLTNSSSVSLHLGYNGWTSETNVVMTKDVSGFWKGTITIPTSANQLDFCFTNGSIWDNNSNGKDWHLQVK